MPNLVGGVLVGFTWQFIVKDVFDSIGQAFHLNFLCNWLSTQATGFWAMVIVVTWQMSGYMMLVYIAQIQNIPDNLLEAASIDGAGSIQQFIRIKLPLMMPASNSAQSSQGKTAGSCHLTRDIKMAQEIRRTRMA